MSKQSNTVRLNRKWRKSIMDMSEAGMGYHVVDVKLRNGSIRRGRIVHNSSFIQLQPEEEVFDIDDIMEILPHGSSFLAEQLKTAMHKTD